MFGIQKYFALFFFAAVFSYGNTAQASKAEAIVNIIKKGVSKADEVSSAAGKNGISHVDDVAKHSPSLGNKNVVNQNAADDISYWQSYAGTQVALRLSECVANRMKIYYGYSRTQALEACKASYTTCKSKKNISGVDDRCITEANKPQSFVVGPKHDYLGPSLDINALKVK